MAKYETKWMIENCMKCEHFGKLKKCFEICLDETANLLIRRMYRRKLATLTITAVSLLIIAFGVGYYLGSRWS